MKKENEVVEGTMVSEEVVENTEVLETKKSLVEKAKSGFNKYGKKIGTGIVLVAAVGIGYMFGKSAGNNGDDTDDYCDSDYSDSDNSESENNNF